MIHTFQSDLGPTICESTHDGATYYHFKMVAACRFAEAILVSYERLNARLEAERREAREGVLFMSNLVIGIIPDHARGSLKAPILYKRPKGPAVAIHPGYSYPPNAQAFFSTHLPREIWDDGQDATVNFASAITASYARMKERHEAAYEAELVPLSAPEYRMLEVGEQICPGDEWRLKDSSDFWQRVVATIVEILRREDVDNFRRPLRKSNPEYRMLRFGELICEGDEVEGHGRWMKVIITVGTPVLQNCVGKFRRRLTN